MAEPLNSAEKHTPGPWTTMYPSPERFTRFGAGYGKSQIIAVDGQAVAAVAIVKPPHGEKYSGGTFTREVFETLEANGNLIAASPDMLAALKDVESAFYGFLNWNHPLWVKVRTAIAKATGEEPVEPEWHYPYCPHCKSMISFGGPVCEGCDKRVHQGCLDEALCP